MRLSVYLGVQAMLGARHALRALYYRYWISSEMHDSVHLTLLKD